jgi:prepilin-type N-terminal cleavage/methylation domain-containing protein
MMKRSGAFTLIELMIATAMISVICSALLYFALSSLRLISRSSDVSSSAQTVRFVAERMSADITRSGGAGAGSGKSRLALGNIIYEYREGKIRREEGTNVYYLTEAGEIKDLKFSYPSLKLINIEVVPKTGGAYSFSSYARN